MTVIGDIPSTSAVSSTLMPPKNRSSITLLFRSSNAASIVKRDQIGARFTRYVQGFVERHLDGITAAFELCAHPGDINQDAPHQLRRHGEEVRAVLPPNPARIDQSQICFVDERRRLERVAGTFSGHVAMRQPMQLAVNQRHQSIQRLLIALIPRQQ